MKFILPAPLDEDIGSEIIIEMEDVAPLRDAIAKWPGRLSRYVTSDKNRLLEHVSSRFLFAQNGRVVQLDDPVTNQSIIHMLLMATGG